MRKILFMLYPAVLTLLMAAFVELYVAEAAAAGVVPLAQVQDRSTQQARQVCVDFEIFWLKAFRCAGWDGGGCQRRSLTRPNNVICYPNFFAVGIGRRQMNCAKVQEWYAPNGGTPRKLSRRKGSATTKWDCRMSQGTQPS